jgi:MoxR-like ATPase
MSDIQQFQGQLAAAGYIAEPALASTLLLLTRMQRPLLLEGDAGVGKTEVAKALATVFDTRLIRLQCYEGLDAASAVYEWNYQRQLLSIKILEAETQSAEDKERHIFGEEFLLKRPLLEAISLPQPPVLLIDEVDRADTEFEAYLLEVLSDFQISIPEFGTVEATTIPYVILTSNGTRELSDALRRRCLYHYVDFPDFDKELRIIRTRVPEIGERLASQVIGFVQSLREYELRKKPGVAEMLDWAAALLQLEVDDIVEDREGVLTSLACLVKTREDRESLTPETVDRLLARSA